VVSNFFRLAAWIRLTRSFVDPNEDKAAWIRSTEVNQEPGIKIKAILGKKNVPIES
jgi:hypothetical protein